LVAVAVGALGIGVVLNLLDSADDVVVAEVVEEVAPPPISHFDVMSVAAPVIRNAKVGRYVTLVARFELKGEGALELTPLVRDAIIRVLHKTPVPLLEDSRDLDPDRLRELFMAAGLRVLGREVVKDVLVGSARASGPVIQREPAAVIKAAAEADAVKGKG
jgi:hypothetical protein